MPRKRKRKPPGPPVLVCIDKPTFKGFLQAVCDLSAALQDAHSTVTMLHELLATKRRQSDAAFKAHETRERNAETAGRIQAELNRAALDAAAPNNLPRNAEEGGAP